jgi:hypothetical protein
MTPPDIAATRSIDVTRKCTDDRACPSPDAIAGLAYHLYETNGRRDGHDIEDWLSAERELTRLLSIFEM